MKSLVKILIFGLLSAFAVSNSVLQAQTNMFGNSQNNSFLNNMKPQISASLTTSFTSFGQGFNSFGTSFLPQITFPVSERLSLSTGVGYSTFFTGNGNESLFHSNHSNYGHVFVSGNYFVNEKITLRGTAYKTFNLGSQNPINETSSPYYDFSSQGIIMDVEYKVTDNFRINVGFEYRQQNYPLYSPGIDPTMPYMGTSSPFSGFNRNNRLQPIYEIF